MRQGETKRVAKECKNERKKDFDHKSKGEGQDLVRAPVPVQGLGGQELVDGLIAARLCSNNKEKKQKNNNAAAAKGGKSSQRAGLEGGKDEMKKKARARRPS